MTYLYLILAILCEVGWAVAMKITTEGSQLLPAIVMFVLYILSVVFLMVASEGMDLGVAYACWAGTGVGLIALAGVVYFNEPLTVVKVISLIFITAGIVGIQLSSSGN